MCRKYRTLSALIPIINIPLYLISAFLYFIFRRKRKGKGARGRARSGGRAHQKGSKQQYKVPQPSPTTSCDLTKLPITGNDQSEQRGNSDKPDGLLPSKDEAEDARTPSAGL